tara:strand:- start:769 stop:1458 length:690 start_codon:yes stop_codon:yes gene_type:complete
MNILNVIILIYKYYIYINIIMPSKKDIKNSVDTHLKTIEKKIEKLTNKTPIEQNDDTILMTKIESDSYKILEKNSNSKKIVEQANLYEDLAKTKFLHKTEAYDKFLNEVKSLIKKIDVSHKQNVDKILIETEKLFKLKVEKNDLEIIARESEKKRKALEDNLKHNPEINLKDQSIYDLNTLIRKSNFIQKIINKNLINEIKLRDFKEILKSNVEEINKLKHQIEKFKSN